MLPKHRESITKTTVQLVARSNTDLVCPEPAEPNRDEGQASSRRFRAQLQLIAHGWLSILGSTDADVNFYDVTLAPEPWKHKLPSKDPRNFRDS